MSFDLYFFRFYVAAVMVGISIISLFVFWAVGFSTVKLTCKNQSSISIFDRFFLGWAIVVFLCWHAFSFELSIKPVLIGVAIIPLIMVLKYRNISKLGKVIRVVAGLAVIELAIGYFFYLELRPR